MYRTFIKFSTFLIFLLVFSHTATASLVAPIKILIVPGHDDEVWGTQYGNLKEADMNLDLGTRIYDALGKDPRFKVYITRDKIGYTKDFANYVADNRPDLLSFIHASKKVMADSVAGGDFLNKKNPPHHKVNDDIALRLYGFNKWANENQMDVMLHVHFNDGLRRSVWTVGKYSGFVIYKPDAQFPNGAGSAQLADSLWQELKTKYDTSDSQFEIGGLASDQKLIALGANNTLAATVSSVLVEYGYVYEKKFQGNSTREKTFQNMAELTVEGLIQNFFGL